MSECMPKVWWSPSELGWFRRDATGRAFVVYGDEVWDELPADAVELKPVSDAPAAPVETELCVRCPLLSEWQEVGDDV